MDSKWKPAASVEVFSINRGEPGTACGTLAIPVRDHINTSTAASLLGTDWSWVPDGQFVQRWIIQGNILTLQRNEAVQRMEGDWILFIDDDMVWQPDTVGRLVSIRDELDLDMVGGLCFRRTDPFQPTLYMREQPTSGAYNFLEKWSDDLVEVDATGMAFCLIHKRVFERIAGSPMPPREERVRPTGFFAWAGSYGEDLAFCQLAKETGSRIFVDTRIQIGHIGEQTITHENYLYAIATRDERTEKDRREVNDRMGLPTMTAAEAKARLNL